MSIAAVPLHSLVVAIFRHAGSGPEEATAIADHLIDANLTGHDSHGVIRVAPYLQLLGAGATIANRRARITKDAGALLTIDGQQGHGIAIAVQAIAIGIERAKTHGVGVLSIGNASHMGRIGAYAEQAAAAGLLSLSLSL